MIFEGLFLLLASATPAKAPAALTALAALLNVAPAPAYKADQRAVDNWRVESALSLDLSPVSALGRALGSDDGEPPRCVKLNNYWCVKRAGWNGEIAADQDGHVAFASAEEGAAVAALLLRRYYVDYGRRSARAIAERWAPVQCGLLPGVAARPGEPVSRAGMARMLPQRVMPMGLAPRGIQNTLRARWLAGHSLGGYAAAPRRHSDDAALDLMPAPEIMQGMGERPRKRPPRQKLALADKQEAAELVEPSPAAPTPLPAPPSPVVDCSGELIRVANYAARIGEGVTNNPDEDLKLFSADSQPTENLAKVMVNMAAVEIGPERPRAALVTVAVAQLKHLLEEPAKPAP